MQRDAINQPPTACPACDFDPFTRNAYWTGKLMLARDFLDEQNYIVEKLRHHNQQLHGWGVACGLRVVPHENPNCRGRYAYVEPGSAVDCCGHDIVLKDKDILDLYAQPEIQALVKNQDTSSYTLRICIRYRECPIELIPVLYDECADESRCAPNRILESYAFGVILTPTPPPGTAPVPVTPATCSSIWLETLKGCPHCDQPNCVILATIQNYTLGNQLVDVMPPPPLPAGGAAVIDNALGREILASTRIIQDVVECILAGEPTAASLTRVSALSWPHRGNATALASITMLDGSVSTGFIVQFDAQVNVDGTGTGDASQLNVLTDAQVFEVLGAVETSTTIPPMQTWANMQGSRIAVSVATTNADKTIATANQLAAGTTTTDALAFLLPQGFSPQPQSLFRFRLHCDFIVDAKLHAVSGEFLAGTLPSGTRQDGTRSGIEGGLFESWSNFNIPAPGTHP
jgi:hypothetical protein